MNKHLFTFLIFLLSGHLTKAQTAKLYHLGSLAGTYSTIDSAMRFAVPDDSILLSAHTFYEHDLRFPKGVIIQGIMTTKDSSIIDAQNKGRIADNYFIKGRAVRVRDVICTNGNTVSGSPDGGGFYMGDSLLLLGRTIVRNCHANRCGGGVVSADLYDYAKITNNTSDSFGGGAAQYVNMYGSSEICYNSSRYGGGVGYVGVGGYIYCNSPMVRIHHNIASVGGGALYGYGDMLAGQITDNQSPLGAAYHSVTCGGTKLENLLIYNPALSGKRQNEIYARSGGTSIKGSWFGKSDTTGLFLINPAGCSPIGAIYGKHAITNWSINRGKALSKSDTLFPIGAAFTYSDGSTMPPNACPWLVGNFTADKGVMLTPNPKVSATDTMSSLFRTFIYVKGDTGSKPINFLCSVHEDTFRVTKMVWGRDTSKLGIKDLKRIEVIVYPNPAKDILNISGANEGSELLLFDVSGKLIISEKVKDTIAKLDISAIPAGNYILKIRTKEGDEGSAVVGIKQSN